MALKITDPEDKRSRTEVLGGAVVEFVRGSAHITGWRLRPSVASAARQRGYRVEFDRHRKRKTETTPPPAPAVPAPVEPPLDPAAPITGQAEGADVVGELVDEDQAAELPDAAVEVTHPDGRVETVTGELPLELATTTPPPVAGHLTP